jgi:hypothetical protein
MGADLCQSTAEHLAIITLMATCQLLYVRDTAYSTITATYAPLELPQEGINPYITPPRVLYFKSD